MTTPRVMPLSAPSRRARRHELVALHQEEVVRRAFAHISCGGEEQPLVNAAVAQFQRAHDVVQVVEALDRRVDGLRVVAPGGQGGHLEALLVDLGRIQSDPAGDAEDRGFGTFVGVETQVADAARDHQANVFRVVAADGLHHHLDKCVPRHGDVESDDLRRGVQPVDMGVEFEYPAVVGPDTLEHAVTIEKTVVEDAYLGVFFAVELAVDVDLHESLLGRLPAY